MIPRGTALVDPHPPAPEGPPGKKAKGAGRGHLAIKNGGVGDGGPDYPRLQIQNGGKGDGTAMGVGKGGAKGQQPSWNSSGAWSQWFAGICNYCKKPGHKKAVCYWFLEAKKQAEKKPRTRGRSTDNCCCSPASPGNLSPYLKILEPKSNLGSLLGTSSPKAIFQPKTVKLAGAFSKK